MAERPVPAAHPDWALAHILVDWRKQRAVSKAYKAVCGESPDANADALIAEALRKCRVYVSALEAVVDESPIPARPAAPQASSHPDWALAYILVDWRKQRAVSKAYKAVCNGSSDADALIAEALRKCRVYVSALEAVATL
jgi:hypothetical protein